MKTPPYTCAILSLFLAVSQAVAQSSDDTDSIEQVFNNVRIIIGDGTVIVRGSVLIRGDTILAVGSMSGGDVSDNAVSHDLSGKTLIPALVNTHAHLG